MTDAPNPTTFDIADLFTGRAFPKDYRDVYLDEALSYEIYKAHQASAAAKAEGNLEKILETDEALEELKAKAESKRVRIHLTGVSRDLRKDLGTKNREQFPPETDFLGREKPNLEADEAFVNEYWALHIEAIERPDGSRINAPDVSTVKIFRANAPDAAIAAIDQGIKELSEGSLAGFESLVTEHDFLSQP